MANIDSVGITAAQQDEKKKCPNCEKGEVLKSVPDPPAWFGPPPRAPKDNETIMGTSAFSATGKLRVGKGGAAKVFIQNSSGRHCYRDLFHKGKGAELEVFDKKGKNHLGTMCAMCGHFDASKQADDRKLILT